MQLLKKIMIAIEKTNIFIGKLMVGVTLLAVTVITFEVVMRYVFGLPTNWGHELMTLLFAVQYMFVAGYCHYHRAHVRVDVFYSTRTRRTQAFLDLFTSIFFFLFKVISLGDYCRDYTGKTCNNPQYYIRIRLCEIGCYYTRKYCYSTIQPFSGI